MTHFNAAVITTSTSPGVDKLMYPYSEYLDVEPYESTDFEALVAEARAKVDEAVFMLQGKPIGENEYYETIAAHDDDDDMELATWFAEFCYGEKLNENGGITSTYNQESKYDYYSEYESMTFDDWLESARCDEEELREQWRELSVNGDYLFKAEYFVDKYGDEDTYVAAAQIPGWAVITPDGVWHEPGKVGWFAYDDATSESMKNWIREFYEEIVPEYQGYGEEVWVHILDCHI